MKPVDLRSDTVTRPTPGMRRAIAEAEVGDDVFGDDPTVRRLEEEMAARLGKEAALYVPSGTMANQIAIRLHTQPGDEVLLEAGAHPLNYEAGGPALLSGVILRAIVGAGGIMAPDDLIPHFRGENDHFAPVSLLCVEDTHNRGGGAVHPLERLDALAVCVHSRGAATHLDGARLFNAEVASGVPVARRARDYDTVSVCLSKGLGAPVGSLLCGPRDLLRRGRRVRKALGGGMRQSGLLAAAGLYALHHNISRLADDHQRAAHLANALKAAGYDVRAPQTNMVFVRVRDAAAAVVALDGRGVRAHPVGPAMLRLVTHLDVDDEGLQTAIDGFTSLADALRSQS
jgi:threonine aldolase